MFNFTGTAKALFLELHFFTLVILFFAFLNTRKENSSFSNRSLRQFFLSIITILVISVAGVLLSGIPGRFVHYAEYAVAVLYFILSGSISYLLLIFTKNLTNPGSSYSKFKLIMYGIACIFLTLFTFISIKTGWLFKVSDENIIERGQLWFIETIVVCNYILISFIWTAITIHKSKKIHERQWYISLLPLYIFTLISISLKFYDKNFPFTWISMSYTLVIIYVTVRLRMISIDGLTGLNNRRKFDYSIDSAISSYDRTSMLVLFFIDINNFKKINDTYGHILGDKVLIYGAGILKKISLKFHGELYRYGGDEFTIIYKCNSISEADRLKIEIYNDFFRPEKKNAFEFPVTASAGYAIFNETEMKDASDFIAKADQSMYAAKKDMHDYLNRGNR